MISFIKPPLETTMCFSLFFHTESYQIHVNVNWKCVLFVFIAAFCIELNEVRFHLMLERYECILESKFKLDLHNVSGVFDDTVECTVYVSVFNL